MSERERALFRFFLCVSTSHLAHTHGGSSNESFIPSTCSCSCERFSSPCSLLLLHALLAALLPFPPALEVRKQVLSPTPTTSRRPQSSPTGSSWTRCRSSPTKSLLRTPTTMTLHSKTCSTNYIERKSITLYEKTSLSSSSMSDR